MDKLILLTAIVTLACGGWACSPRMQQTGGGSPADETASYGYAEDATEVEPVATGTRIPDVSVRNTTGETVDIRELVSRKPTVLIFYRGGWCPYCNTHMAKLQQIEQELVDMGYQIAAISPDRPELLKESVAEHDLSYSLYSDSPMTASKAFGLAYRLDDKKFNNYLMGGLNLTERSGHDHHLLPVPAAFLVDTDGKILFQYVNPDYTVRIQPEELLAAAEKHMTG